MKNNKILIYLLISLIAIFPVTIYAGWLDDYVVVNSAPTDFRTITRSSISGGDLSIRIRPRTDPLFNIELPRLKAGCGGIDIFMGSFSYLNPQYLVEKLQKILKVAPAAAFQLAIQTLCEPCKNVMDTLESIVNAFNSLQLDDCAAAKALVAVAAKPFVTDPKIQGNLQNQITDFMVSSGINQLYHTVKSGIEKVGQPSNPAQTKQDLSNGCSANFKSVFMNSGSFLDNIANTANIDSRFIPIIRGMIGDIQITNSSLTASVDYKYVPPCDGNNSNIPTTSLINGTFMARNSVSGSCSSVLLVNGSLISKYYNTALSIYNKMKDKSGLAYTTDEINFIKTPGVPVPLMLKHAVFSGDTMVLNDIAYLVSEKAAINALEEAIETAITAINTAKQVSSAQKHKPANDDKQTNVCDLELFQSAFEQMQLLEDNIEQTRYILSLLRQNANEHSRNLLNKYNEAEKLNQMIIAKFKQQISLKSMKE